MVRADFDRHLRELQEELLTLGDLVEQAIAKAMDALKNRDLALSQQVVDEDDVIDSMRFQLEDRCIDLMATQQPIAIDLRTLISVLHISVELERMGDYAEGIAKISLSMGQEPLLTPLIDLPRMAQLAATMLHGSLESLTNRDVALATQICADDDEVDSLYDQVYRKLLSYMIEDPETIQRATYLLWVSHDLERIADRATNIAERVIFMVTGKLTGVKASNY